MELEHKTDRRIAEPCQFVRRKPRKVAPVITDFAGIRPVECAHDMEQRGLTCTARPYNRHHLPRFHVKAHPTEHLQAVETFAYVAKGNHMRGYTWNIRFYQSRWSARRAIAKSARTRLYRIS